MEIEFNYPITSETSLLQNNVKEQINNFFTSGRQGTYVGKRNINIFYKIFLQKKKSLSPSILISNGRGESIIKFKETLFNFYNLGFSLYIIDHRGQGLSDRILSNPQIGYVESYDYYVADLKFFFDNFVKPNSHSKNFILGHSMGGAIATLYVEQYRKDFDAMVLSSPLLGLKFPFCILFRFLKIRSKKFTFGRGDYNFEKTSFEQNETTNSKIRYSIIEEENSENFSSVIGGPSHKWVYETCKALIKLRNNSKNIVIPILILQAQNDTIVSLKSQNKFFTSLKKRNDTELDFHKLNGAKHEIFVEKDEIRKRVFYYILDFFNKV